MSSKANMYPTSKGGTAYTATDHYEHRQRRRNRRRPAPIASAPVRLPTVAKLADHENLIKVYYDLKAHAGAAPGLDGITYSYLSRREVPEAMRVLSKSVLNGTYAPYPGRTKPILKADGVSHRDLTLRSIFDRVVAKALQVGLEAFWESIFVHRSMAWRPRRGVRLLLAELEREMVLRNHWVLAVDDVKGAFDNVNIDHVMADHRLYIQDTQLLGLIEVVLRGGDPSKNVGIDQGSPYSPTALNLRLHHAHDTIFEANSVNPPWYRFGDNLVYVCQSVPEGIQVLERVREQLELTGLTLKGVDGQPRDLLKGERVQFLGFQLYCRKGEGLRPNSDFQPHSHSGEGLEPGPNPCSQLHGHKGEGLEPGPSSNLQPQHRKGEGLRLELGPDALTKLKQHLEEAHETVDPPRTAKEAVRGWIEAHGPALGEEVRDVVLTNTLGMATQIGFREIGSRTELMQWMAYAYQDWCSYRETVGRRTDRGYIPGAGG